MTRSLQAHIRDLGQDVRAASSVGRWPCLKRTIELCAHVRDWHSTMTRSEKIERAGQLRRQGLALAVIASRLGVSTGEASKLAKQATQNAVSQTASSLRG